MTKIKRRKKKKKKDPLRPKRAMSSFMMFANERRPELKKANPNLKITEMGSELGKIWKTFSPEEKKKYEELAARDKARYLKEMATYKPPEESDSSSDGGGRKRKKKKKKDPLKPKRAMSSFMYFQNEKRQSVRDANPSLKIPDIGKKMSEMWKELSEDEKKKYVDQAEKDKERYRKEIATYKEPAPVLASPVRSDNEQAAASASSSDSESSSDHDN